MIFCPLSERYCGTLQKLQRRFFMTIVSDGKNIDTLPFQNLFVQGEKLSEKITFRIPRYYNDKDLLPCIFIIKGVNEKNEVAEQVLAVSNKISSLELEWNVASIFTSASGKLKLEIQALISNGGELSYSLKYILPPVYVKESPNGENIPVPDVKEQTISEINSVVSAGLSEINQKIESFDTTEFDNRLDTVESSLNNLESQIRIEAMTLSEYNTESHSDNILYVII